MELNKKLGLIGLIMGIISGGLILGMIIRGLIGGPSPLDPELFFMIGFTLFIVSTILAGGGLLLSIMSLTKGSSKFGTAGLIVSIIMVIICIIFWFWFINGGGVSEPI